MKRFYSYDEIVEYVKSSDADSIYNYIEYLEGIRRDKTYGLVWEKEKEYKAMVFSELGIKVDENYEIQI